MTADLRRRFLLDPDVCYLNHGAFGAAPVPVFETYQRWQRELERQPTRFLTQTLEPALADARRELAGYVGAGADDLAFVPNATTGINVVARSMRLEPGDEILSCDHEYGAFDLAWRAACEAEGAIYRKVQLPVPLTADGVVEAITAGFSERTRALTMSHITSPTAAILPVDRLCGAAAERGILTVVDGAHAPGQVPVDLRGLGVDIYTGNAHKWLVAPKGAGFLYVHLDHQRWMGSNIISWGWSGCADLLDHADCSFVRRSAWQGTSDPAASVSVPAAISFHGTYLAPRRGECGQLALEARGQIAERFGCPPLLAEEMVGQFVACPIPSDDPAGLHDRLLAEHGIEVPVFPFGDVVLIRPSFAGYNEADDLERLLAALESELGRDRP
ncbi:MAG TPA: aminotransferase class V-fold PLP-dependent enzyme [Gaiellales bacterium]|nr:aminotransferase class V-fold PLP-dependent enzyme [Gaiellales bacterium]